MHKFTEENGGKKFHGKFEISLKNLRIMWPPENHKMFYLYPRLSPNYRQSQVDFEHPDLSAFPEFKLVNSYEVVLEEGDLLYLPPFWFHRVESVGPKDVILR